MKLVDLNLLLYAINESSEHHVGARRWLDRTLAEDELVGIPWVVILGFLRLTTSKHVFAKPLSIPQASALIQSWLDHPRVRAVTPGADHWNILRPLLARAGAGGNLTTDAHLAALALEHGAELCSSDADFARFGGLSWTNPLESRDR